MDVVQLNQKQLAARWCISEATLERWRGAGIGPKFLKLCGRVLYRQADIEAYEESCVTTKRRNRPSQAVGCGAERRAATARRVSATDGANKKPQPRTVGVSLLVADG